MNSYPVYTNHMTTKQTNRNPEGPDAMRRNSDVPRAGFGSSSGFISIIFPPSTPTNIYINNITTYHNGFPIR